MNRIAILGAGTWGIALARMLSNTGHSVTVWSTDPGKAEQLSRSRQYSRLPNMVIPPDVAFTGDIRQACEDAEIIVLAVASVYVRETARRIAAFLNKDQIIVVVAKGIEPDTLLTMTEVIRSEVGEGSPIVALSGPTHAEEVAVDLPTTIVAACEDNEIAETVQKVFSCPYMRVYTNTDVLGVELGAALKNIIALAAGISAGLGYGDNAKAALITRGLAEIERLGSRMGCVSDTFRGLAGMGDLIVTATSNHSRNNNCGYLIGQGYSVPDAVKQVGMVVEGINAIPAAIALAEKYGVEMPITYAVDQIVNHGKDPKRAVGYLMGRDFKPELVKPAIDVRYERAVLRNFGGRPNGDASMKRVITYGTFDLLHYGHINLLRRAKALGDYLIVAVSTDEFNWNEKHKKCHFTYEQRKALVESVRYVDLVIPEENWEQKKTDVHEYHIDTFVIGDDWAGRFDFLKDEGVDVVYLPRTPEISTTRIEEELHAAT